MKIRVIMKTPDALNDAIERAVEDEMPAGDSEDLEGEFVTRTMAARKIAEKWFSYGELVTLVIDTEANTCTVESH